MNLRKDHYRVRALWVQPPTRVYLPYCFGGPALTGRRGVYTPGPAPAEDTPNSVGRMQSENKYTLFKTFNNGSLGSGIDEERSEMRYVM